MSCASQARRRRHKEVRGSILLCVLASLRLCVLFHVCRGRGLKDGDVESAGTEDGLFGRGSVLGSIGVGGLEGPQRAEDRRALPAVGF